MGNWEWGNGQWAMGIGQWAMGNGQWAMGIKEAQDSDTHSNTILSMPHAPCPMPHYLVQLHNLRLARHVNRIHKTNTF